MKKSESGSTLIISLVTMVVLASFVGLAVDYTANVARNGQRDRAFNTAVEIGDGCVSEAFAAWRQVCKTNAAQAPKTSDFATIPMPAQSNFPSLPPATTISRSNVLNPPAYTISNYKVQAVDPLITLTWDDAVHGPVSAWSTTTPPPSCTGPGTGTFSFFYLASADVTLPAVTGTLTAKVRRILEKRYSSPWNWAMLYGGELELHPDANLTLNGWVHSNTNVYVGNGSSDPGTTPAPTLTLTDRLTYQGGYNLGFDPNDGPHTITNPQYNVVAPNTDANFPPGHEQFYAPFGWDNSKFSGSNPDASGYHEMIEPPVSPYGPSSTDPFMNERMYNQAGIVITIDATNTMKVYLGSMASGRSDVTGQTGIGNGGTAATAATASISTNNVVDDFREASNIRVVDFDVAQFLAKYPTNTTKGWNGIVYITDTSAGTSVPISLPGPTTGFTTKRGIRIKNGAKIPNGGMTVVSNNPVYVKGDFNSGRTSTTEPPSNMGDPTDPDVGYTRQPASIMGDAVTLLSNNWNDVNTFLGLSSRIASNTTINGALMAGNVPTGTNGTNYSGGGENFVRFLEDWTGKSFTYYGSMLGLYASTQATGSWGTNASNTYRAPTQYWYFDSSLSLDSTGNPVTVPGYVSTVAYLQQQRWYLQY